jgi:hypothetical protein
MNDYEKYKNLYNKSFYNLVLGILLGIILCKLL